MSGLAATAPMTRGDMTMLSRSSFEVSYGKRNALQLGQVQAIRITRWNHEMARRSSGWRHKTSRDWPGGQLGRSAALIGNGPTML